MDFNAYVDLDRRFVPLSDSAGAERAAFDSYVAGLHTGDGLGWSDLLKRRIAVVLGEAGSGKTWEFRRRAEVPGLSGERTFFIPLDRLVDGRPEDALTGTDRSAFLSWRNSRDRGVFFLDSVDEAKFRRTSDFGLALDHFAEGIGAPRNLDRIRIMLSSRCSEWQPQTDREELARRFGVDLKRTGAQSGNSKDDTQELLVVQIAPLDRERVERYARGVGLPEPRDFLDALDRNHAWEFARRPIDVADLIHYWAEHGRLGTLLELIEFDVERKIREAGHRRKNDPLTDSEAREGAEALGAAAVLCRRFSFLVADAVPPGDMGGAIAPGACLPEAWTGAMQSALLNRPLFDSETYGRIRFHHRRVAEYLAAQWLNGRMAAGCTYPMLEDLLFVTRGADCVLRESMRPVAAWLALFGAGSWSRHIRTRVLHCAPDLFLSQCDAASLPVEYRRDLLRELVARCRGRDWVRLDEEEEGLSRLAHPELAPDIVEIVRDCSTSTEIRILMLRMIRRGNLTDCSELLLEIMGSTAGDEGLKAYAAAAIRDVGDTSSKARLAAIAQGMDSLDTNLAGILGQALYPAVIDAAGLGRLLRKVPEVGRYSASLPWSLKEHLRGLPELPQVAALARELIGLGRESPYVGRAGVESSVSARYWWVEEPLEAVLCRWLGSGELLVNDDATTAAEALSLLEEVRDAGVSLRDASEELRSVLDRQPEVRRAYAWIRIERHRRRHPDHPLGLYAAFDFDGFFRPHAEDLDWLIRDCSERPSYKDREAALRVAIGVWWQSGRLRSSRRRLRDAVRQNRELRQLFGKLTANGLGVRARRLVNRIQHGDIHWGFRRAWRKVPRAVDMLRGRLWLLRHLRQLRDGSAVAALSHLARESDRGNHWGVASHLPLIEKHGSTIARAAVAGWKASWKRFHPPLPHERPDPNRVDIRIPIGLSGINAGLLDGDIEISSFSSEEAQLACRYAVQELNGFPDWMTDLSRHHPHAVRDVLMACIRGEWQIPGDRAQVHEVSSKLRYERAGLSSLIADAVLSELEIADPLHDRVLEDALAIICAVRNPPREALASLAASRTVNCTSGDVPRYVIWLTMWLQTDAAGALSYLRGALPRGSDPADLVVRICDGLHYDVRSSPPLKDPNYVEPCVLREFIPFVFEHVRLDEDIDRVNDGAYSPTARDHAQEFRGSLLPRLADSAEPEAEEALRFLAGHPVMGSQRDLILHLLDRRAKRLADGPPWEPQDVRAFARDVEPHPRSASDLHRMALRRMREIKDAIERSENSLRDEVPTAEFRERGKELHLRRWLARKLAERSNGSYDVVQETEIDLRQRPDIRVLRTGLGPVSIEVKWADDWTLQQLEEGLLDQLAGRYLRAVRSNHGIYAIGCRGEKKTWEDAPGAGSLSFEGLVSRLGELAGEYLRQHLDIEDLSVVGLDFRLPA